MLKKFSFDPDVPGDDSVNGYQSFGCTDKYVCVLHNVYTCIVIVCVCEYMSIISNPPLLGSSVAKL